MKTRRHLVAVAIGLLSAAGSAQAAVVYQGSWDPKFGAGFPTMGWRVDAQVVLSDACAAATADYTGRIATSLDFDGDLFFGAFETCRVNEVNEGLRVTNLVLGLYDFAEDPNGPTTEAYELDADYVVPDSGFCYGDGTQEFDCVQFVDFFEGRVVGLQTSFNDAPLVLIGSEQSYLSAGFVEPGCGPLPVFGLSRDADWYLRLGANLPGGLGGAVSELEASFGECGGGSFASEFQPTRVTLERLDANAVPEPGSMALVVAALGGLLATAGLRRRAARNGRV